MRYHQIRLNEVLTTLREAKRPQEELKRLGPSRDPKREEALGLKFIPGDRIKDLITKKGGEVIAGTRKTIAVQSTGG